MHAVTDEFRVDVVVEDHLQRVVVHGDGRRFSILCHPEAGSRFTLDLIGVASSFPVLDTLDDARVGPGTAESA